MLPGERSRSRGSPDRFSERPLSTAFLKSIAWLVTRRRRRLGAQSSCERSVHRRSTTSRRQTPGGTPPDGGAAGSGTGNEKLVLPLRPPQFQCSQVRARLAENALKPLHLRRKYAAPH